MDILAVAAIVDEIGPKLSGAAVKKIHQPAADQFIFRFWTGREELKLLVSARPQAARVHLTLEAYPNPFTPPRFCQLLRSRLGRLVHLAQVPQERILLMDFTQADKGPARLVIELFGRRPNLVLLDEQGTIVDALTRQPEGRRPIMPGLVYEFPPQGLKQDLGQGVPDLPEFPEDGAGYGDWLLRHIVPMTALTARDLEAAVKKGGSPRDVLEAFRRNWLQRRRQPQVGNVDGTAVLSVLPLQALDMAEVHVFDEVSEALDYFFSLQVGTPGVDGDRTELEQAVRKRLRQLEKRVENIEGEKLDPEQIQEQRRIGELLLSQLYKVRQGMKEVVLDDYFADPPVALTVSLDPLLSPQANAERYFKGFKKGKRGADHIDRRLEETQQEVQWLQGVELALAEAANPQDLLAIRMELEEAGMLTVPKGPESRRRGTDPKEQLRHCKSPGGFELYWGRNNRTNDYVSRDITDADDLWFHAQGIPGCHLVLKRAGFKGEIPPESILYAASLTAGYSRGKNDARVEVMYTEGRHVRRPKGARPGLVTVDKYRTLLVEPKRID